MNTTYLWGNALPLAIFVTSLWLLLIALRYKWPADVATTELPDPPGEAVLPAEKGPVKERIKGFIVEHRWEFILGGTVAAVLLFALIFAPPRLNGSVAIQPNTAGRPFYSLRWIRSFLSTFYDKVWVWSSALSSVFCLALLAWAIRKRTRPAVQFVVLCASLNIAAVAQWLLPVGKYLIPGKIFYFIAILGLCIWAWLARKRLLQGLESRPVARNVEVLIILGLLLLTSFNRLYALRTIPYGIEGDEAKWTSEAVNLGIRGTPDSSGEYHRDALPVSYYLQMPLHRLLGPSLFAARLTVVLLSIGGTLIFYWLLRQITVFPVAAIATYLLSISIFDISASRLANVESFVKIWPILGLALLALAVRMKRWQVYGLSGVAIALGMLTYDTVWPVFGVVLIIAIIELIRQKESLRSSMSAIGALVAPALMALPVLIPYVGSRLPYYEFEDKGLDPEAASKIAEHFGGVIRTWFIALRSDFLYNRPGPLLNALLLPFLVLGLVAAFFLIKKRVSYWTLLWVALVVFPIPILAQSPMGRVYYPALPAVYVLVALGIYFFWREANLFFGPNIKPLVMALALVPMVWLPLANLYIYFNEVYDAQDRLMRREIAEMGAQAAGPGTLILLPATPSADTPLNNEYQMLELYMLQKVPSSELSKSYQHIAPELLMSGIQVESANYQKIEVIFDKSETATLAQSLPMCYPQGKLIEGKYFDRFSLDSAAAGTMNCNLATLSIELATDNTLNWQLSKGTAQRLELDCETRRVDFRWFEMENFFMESGWQTETEFAPGWSGTGFVMDNYGSGPLFLDILPEQPQKSYIWLRHFQRTMDDTSLSLNIDGIPYHFGDIRKGNLNTWRWERIGPVDLDNGSEFSISRTYEGDPKAFMSIFIDSLAITSDPDFSPDNDLWASIPAREYTLPQAQSGGSLKLDLPPDSYRCKLIVGSDLPVMDALGNPSPFLTSNLVEFDIR